MAAIIIITRIIQCRALAKSGEGNRTAEQCSINAQNYKNQSSQNILYHPNHKQCSVQNFQVTCAWLPGPVRPGLIYHNVIVLLAIMF